MTTEELKAEYNQVYPRILHIIRGRFQPWNTDRNEERIANALAHSWELFRKYRPSADNATQAAITAAGYACKIKRTLGHARPNKHGDALDHSHELPHKLEIAAKPEIDLPNEEDLVRQLPINCQPIARLLLAGLTRVQISRRRGCSPATITRRCEEIGEFLTA